MSAPEFRPMKKPRAVAKTGLPVPTEHAEQVHVVEWAAWRASRDRRLGNLFAIGNGGLRPARLVQTAGGVRRVSVVGRKLKSEGMKEGVPDLFLAWPSNGQPGLFVEMKRATGGRLSPAQKEWRERLTRAGYAWRCAKGADEAIREIEAYLEPQAPE